MECPDGFLWARSLWTHNKLSVVRTTQELTSGHLPVRRIKPFAYGTYPQARPCRYCRGTPTMSTIFCYYQTAGSQAAAKTKAFEYGLPINNSTASSNTAVMATAKPVATLIPLSAVFLDSSNERIQIKQVGFDLKATWLNSKNSIMSPTDIHSNGLW